MRKIALLFVLLIAVSFSVNFNTSQVIAEDTKSIQLSALAETSEAKPKMSIRPELHVAESFCGACTTHSACGPGNRCCRSNCPRGKYRCVNNVSTCP